MQPLASDYLAEIARQIGFISAFLGGISASFMAALLALHVPRRVGAWTVILAAAASVAFIIAVVASTLLVMALHPHAPANVATHFNVDRGRLLAFAPFGIGIYLLLACLGLSGWLRSPRTGKATSGIAAAGILLVTMSLVG